MAVKTSDLVIAGLIAGVGVGAYFLYKYLQEDENWVNPNPPENDTIEAYDAWFKSNFPSGRRLTDGEATSIEVEAAWVALSWSGNEPTHGMVATLNFEATKPSKYTLEIEADTDKLDNVIADLVGRIGDSKPPLLWDKWTNSHKAVFITAVEAIALITSPRPDETEAQVRRALYYKRIGDTKGMAYLFHWPSYTGNWLKIISNTPILDTVGDWNPNDSSNSIMIQSGREVVLHSEINYGGLGILLQTSCDALAKFKWANKTRSIEVIS